MTRVRESNSIQEQTWRFSIPSSATKLSSASEVILSFLITLRFRVCLGPSKEMNLEECMITFIVGEDLLTPEYLNASLGQFVQGYLHSLLSCLNQPFKVFFRDLFVICCRREEGLGSQLATYWLFQSPDPMVCLECIPLLCRVKIYQVSGWDKTGVRRRLGISTTAEHRQTCGILEPFWSLLNRKTISSTGASLGWGGEFNFSHWWTVNQSWSAFAFLAHLCLTSVAWSHKSQPHDSMGPLPLCCHVKMKLV